MTVSLNEISELLQRIDSILDDSDDTVLCVHVDPGHTFVHLEAITFMTEFIEYEIEVSDDEEYPYDLKAKIGGVEFTAVMSASEVLDLKESIPDQFDYISSKVQVDIDGS